MIRVETPDALAAHLGTEAQSTKTARLSSELIDAFIGLSRDDQPLHRGPEAIAPGNLLLALAPRLLQSAIQVRQFDNAMTARIDRVAFLRPARVGEVLTLTARLTRVSRLRAVSQQTRRCAVTADCLLRIEAPIARFRVTDVYTWTEMR